MAEVWVRELSGSSVTSKNVHVQVSGYLDPKETVDWRRIIVVEQFNAKGVRLDSVNYALSEKTEILLAWDKSKGEEEHHVFLPLNGRGRLDFDSVNGLQNTVVSGKSGDVLLSASSELSRRSHFTLTLDFSKQGV